MKKKVLILNEGKTDNYGDIAINSVITKCLENNNIDVKNELFWSEATVFGNQYYKFPKIIRWILWNCAFFMDFFNRIHVKKVIKEKFDCIVIGGGELLGCNYGFNSSLDIWTKLAMKNNIPVIVYGVSGSKDLPKSRLKRYKRALQRCDKIYVRDNYTKNMLTDFYKVDCLKTPDCVFAYRKVFNDTIGDETNSKCTLVAPILFYDGIKKGLNLPSEQKYLEYLKTFILNNTNNKNDLIITCTDKGDESFTNKLYNCLREDKNFEHKNLYLEKYTSLDNYISLVKKSNLVISNRMHAMILGKIYGCEILPIVFKKKLEVFEKEYKELKNIEKIEENSYSSLQELADYINDIK